MSDDDIDKNDGNSALHELSLATLLDTVPKVSRAYVTETSFAFKAFFDYISEAAP